MWRSRVFVLLALGMLIGLTSGGFTMTTAQTDPVEANKQVVKDFIAVLNGRDLAMLDALATADFLEHNPFVVNPPPGIETFKQTAGALLAAFPDASIVIELIVAEGDLVVTRHMVTATHKGDFFGVPATNKPIGWTENHIWRVKDGKIAEHWAEANVLGILIQIGAVPAPGAPPATMEATPAK